MIVDEERPCFLILVPLVILGIMLFVTLIDKIVGVIM